MLIPLTFACSPSRLIPEINEGRVTKAKLDNTVRSVSKWKDTAELWGTTENMDNAGQMMAELERLLEEVGVAVRKSSTQPKAKAGSKQSKWDVTPTLSNPDKIYRAFRSRYQSVKMPGNRERPH